MKRILIGLLASASLVATTAVAQPASSALARIKAAKAINVAVSTDALPFSFSGPDTKNEPVGYSIDLCKRAIAQIGRAVGEPNLKVNWINGTTPERLQMVAEGKAVATKIEKFDEARAELRALRSRLENWKGASDRATSDANTCV